MLAESASFLALNEADFTIWPLKRNFLELNNIQIVLNIIDNNILH